MRPKTLKVLACPEHGTEFMGAARCNKEINRFRFCHRPAQEVEVVPLSEVKEVLLGEAEHFENVRFLAEQESLQYGMKGEHLGEHEAKGIAVTARNARNAFTRIAASFHSDSEEGQR